MRTALIHRLSGVLSLALFVACRSDSAGPALPLVVGDVSAAAIHAVGPPASIVFHSARDGSSRIYVMNPDGTGERAITTGPGDFWPDLSPDGRFVVFRSNRSGNNEIYVADVNGGTPVNISNSTANDDWPRWSPNGHRIAFHSNRDGNFNIFTVTPDGSDLRHVTTDAALDQWADWSPNGQQLAFRRGMDVYVADADGEEQNVRRLTFLSTVLSQMPAWSPAVNLTPKGATDASSAWQSRAPSWSKNGKQIYFMSFRPSTFRPGVGNDVEIFVMNADGSQPTRLTNATGEDGGPRSR